MSDLFDVELFLERYWWRRRGGGGGGGGGVGGGGGARSQEFGEGVGGGGVLYLMLHSHNQNDFSIKTGSDEGHILMFQ